MNFLVFSALCIGLAAAHTQHSTSYSYRYDGSGAQRQRQLVDVPYTVEVLNVGSAGSALSHGTVGRSYQAPAQIQVQSVPLVHQSTSSVHRQPQQLVYTVPSVQVASGHSNAGIRYLPYNTGSTIQIQHPVQQQVSSGVQLVQVPHHQIVSPSVSTYNLGNSLPISTIGSGSGQRLGGNTLTIPSYLLH